MAEGKERVSVSDLLTYTINAAGQHVKPATLDIYNRQARRLCQLAGATPADALTNLQAEKIYTSLCQVYDISTARETMKLLRRAYANRLDQELVSRNPLAKMRLKMKAA